MENCNNSGSALCKIMQSKIIILSLNMESNNYCYVEFWRQPSIFKLRIKYTHAYIYMGRVMWKGPGWHVLSIFSLSFLAHFIPQITWWKW